MAKTKTKLQEQLSIRLKQAGISERQNRLLAMVALFQAAQLTYLLANQGKNTLNGYNNESYQIINQAALNIQNNDTSSLFSLDHFQGLDQLQLGLRSLEGALIQPYQNTKSRLPMPRQYGETFRYAMALLQLEKKVYKKPSFIQRIESEQANIKQRLHFFDNNIQHPSIVASLATLYVDTAGQLTPRLSIRGKPDYLKHQPTIDAIRATLFAGLQAAHLWRQLGGNRWQLIFGRKQMLDDLRQLAKVRYQSQPPFHLME